MHPSADEEKAVAESELEATELTKLECPCKVKFPLESIKLQTLTVQSHPPEIIYLLSKVKHKVKT